jgi:oligopeptide/dipeptide ABC transporter ATP-binding protein
VTPLVEAKDLALEYRTVDGPVRALDGADLVVSPRATLGIVGESGSGKTTLGLAIGRLLPENTERAAGDLLVGGASVFGLDASTLRRLRRERLGFVFQNPMAVLDPTMRVGRQLALALDGETPPARIAAALAEVELTDVERVARSYPHELSGGMAQRVVVAIAVARRPALLVADEPTSALDATVREEVLRLIVGLRKRIGASIILLSHELRVVARHCDEVAVMYGGRVVERAASASLFSSARHPYTVALLRAAPGREKPGERLEPIPGGPPTLRSASRGCAFAPRCPVALDICRSERPLLRPVAEHLVACHRA